MLNLPPAWLAAIERALRTFIQAASAAALVLMTQEGASWSVLPEAASVGAFAGLIAFVAMFAVPPQN